MGDAETTHRASGEQVDRESDRQVDRQTGRQTDSGRQQGGSQKSMLGIWAYLGGDFPGSTPSAMNPSLLIKPKMHKSMPQIKGNPQNKNKKCWLCPCWEGDLAFDSVPSNLLIF